MFRQFLVIIDKGEILSHLEIAQQMGITPTMVVEIAKELTRRGYLSEYSADCHAAKASCNGCDVSAACQIMGRTWSLTDKGKNYLRA
jgi:DNA-binding Lrp family transcriptional regulator